MKLHSGDAFYWVVTACGVDCERVLFYRVRSRRIGWTRTTDEHRWADGRSRQGASTVSVISCLLRNHRLYDTYTPVTPQTSAHFLYMAFITRPFGLLLHRRRSLLRLIAGITPCGYDRVAGASTVATSLPYCLSATVCACHPRLFLLLLIGERRTFRTWLCVWSILPSPFLTQGYMRVTDGGLHCLKQKSAFKWKTFKASK